MVQVVRLPEEDEERNSTDALVEATDFRPAFELLKECSSDAREGNCDATLEQHVAEEPMDGHES